MKKYYFLFLNAVFFLFSCNYSTLNKNTSSNETNFNDSTEVKIKINSEKKLKRDLEIYLNSMVIGDVSETFKYTHTISMDLLKKKYPEHKTTASLVTLFKNQFKNTHIDEIHKSLNMKFIPGEITGGAVHGNTKIYCVEFQRIGSNANDKVNIQSNVIALSDNNGNDWKFIEYDIPNKDKFINLLSKYYPEKIVKQAFNSGNSMVKINFPTPIKTSNKVEIKLLEDTNSYFESIKNNNKENALNYIYEGVFTFLMENSILNNDQTKNELVNIFNEPSNSKTIKEFRSRIICDEFLSIVKYNSNLIYVVHFYLFGKKESDYYSFGGEYVAISNNNGQNWKFIAMSDITSSILQKEFPLTVINKLFEFQKK